MKSEVDGLKNLVMQILKEGSESIDTSDLQKVYAAPATPVPVPAKYNAAPQEYHVHRAQSYHPDIIDEEPEEVEESLSIEEKEKELIKKALEKYKGRRKNAAAELGISERTLYRKIKEYELN